MTNEKLRVIAMLETARTEMIAKGVNGWPNAVLAAIELLSTPPGDDEVEPPSAAQRTAYIAGIARAADIVRRWTDHEGSLVIDCDKGTIADEPTLAYVVQTLDQRVAKMTARAAITAIPSRGEARAAELEGALRRLCDDAENQLCQHENTHRGGLIWTICDECDRKWADDEGGFVPYSTPDYISRARAVLAPSEESAA